MNQEDRAAFDEALALGVVFPPVLLVNIVAESFIATLIAASACGLVLLVAAIGYFFYRRRSWLPASFPWWRVVLAFSLATSYATVGALIAFGAGGMIFAAGLCAALVVLIWLTVLYSIRTGRRRSAYVNARLIGGASAVGAAFAGVLLAKWPAAALPALLLTIDFLVALVVGYVFVDYVRSLVAKAADA